MINQQKIIGVLGLILFTLVFCPVSGGAIMTFQPNDGNVRYLNDVHRSTGSSESRRGVLSVTTGDFDGNGSDDAAVYMLPFAGHRTIDLFLSPFEAESTFSIKKAMEIRLSVSDESGNLTHRQSLVMGDLNGDGMADLIVGRQDYSLTLALAEVDIVLGKKNPTGVLDLDVQEPDCRIIGVSQVAVGDFDGDGNSDLAMIKAGSSKGYIGLGGPGKFSGVIDIPVSHPFHRITLNGNLTRIMSGDFNGDNKTDFVFSGPDSDLGEANIVFGKGTLPTPPSSDGLPVDVRLIGDTDVKFVGMAVGDMTGDGQSELILKKIGGGTLWAINGSDLSSGKPILLQAPGQPNSVSFHSVGSSDEPYMAVLDFDGDGADDTFPKTFYNITSGVLTSEIHPGGIPLSEVGAPVLEWVGTYFFSSEGKGDLNGDGFKDLVVYEDFNSLYPPYGALRVLYGFRPLKNPSVRALLTEIASPRISLALSVDGNPTEMFLSGHITNDFKDKWIPFKTIQDVLLSSAEGTKTVTVNFRNAVGRTSDLAQTTVDIQAKSSAVVTGTNRLRPGGTVAFDCHVLTSGTFRARIYSSAGKQVRALENRMVDPGIYPLFWDGRNGSGNLVGRGVYFLVIEANGERTKKEILVE